MPTYTSTSKILNLLPYVLLEYQYTILPSVESYPVNFGVPSVGFEKIYNGYTKSNQILNRLQDVDVTGNTRETSVVQIANNTFVTLDINYLTQYLDYDQNLTPTANLPVIFPSNIVVQYDTLKFHYLSGYNFPNIDGNIFQVQYTQKNGTIDTFAQVIIEKSNTSNIQLNPNPIYYNGGIFDKYLEIKIPALANLTYVFETLSGSSSQSETLAALTSTNGGGFTMGAPFTITGFEIAQTTSINVYSAYVCNYVNSATMTQFDEYSYLAAVLNENVDKNYWEYYPTWSGEFIDQFLYTENALGNVYYVTNDITVSEQIGLSLVKTSQFQSIQTSGFDQPLIFRPIVTNSKATSFTIDYTATLINKSNNTSIVRMSSVTSYETDLYGTGLNTINLMNAPYPLKVYNNLSTTSDVTSAYKINVNPINNTVIQYVPAFYEMENITIAEQDLTITNIGSTAQSSNTDGTIAFGQGNLQIIVNPFDNYYQFRIFNSNTNAENTILDLGTNSNYYLVFSGDTQNQQIKVASLTDATFQNPSQGQIAFRVVESVSMTIQNYTNRDFFITSLSPNGIETSLYYGTWLLPSERYLKATAISNLSTSGTSGLVSSGTSGKANTLTNIGIATTQAISSTTGISAGVAIKSSPNINISTSNIKSTFDVINDNILLSIPPISSNVTTSGTSGNSGSAGTAGGSINLVALANSIAGDAALGKAYNDIADYYTIPGRPGNNLYRGITKITFLSAVRRVYPDISGTYSATYLEYAKYLSINPSSTDL